MTGWTVLVATHAFAACLAVPLGAYQVFRRPRGDARHRRLGLVWVVAMLYVATSSFWIRELRDGRLSLLHVLSVVSLVSVIDGVVAARRGQIPRHRADMLGAWLGLVGAMVGALAVPARTIPTFVVTEPAQALAALGALVATFAAVLGLARLGLPDAGGARGRRRARGRSASFQSSS